MAEKQYLSGNGKEVVFSDGNSLINVYIDLDDAKEKGLIFKTKNGKNAIAFTMAKKSTVGEYGDTHYLYHKPSGGGSTTAARTVVAKPAAKAAPKDEPSDDLPF